MHKFQLHTHSIITTTILLMFITIVNYSFSQLNENASPPPNYFEPCIGYDHKENEQEGTIGCLHPPKSNLPHIINVFSDMDNCLKNTNGSVLPIPHQSFTILSFERPKLDESTRVNALCIKVKLDPNKTSDDAQVIRLEGSLNFQDNSRSILISINNSHSTWEIIFPNPTDSISDSVDNFGDESAEGNDVLTPAIARVEKTISTVTLAGCSETNPDPNFKGCLTVDSRSRNELWLNSKDCLEIYDRNFERFVLDPARGEYKIGILSYEDRPDIGGVQGKCFKVKYMEEDLEVYIFLRNNENANNYLSTYKEYDTADTTPPSIACLSTSESSYDTSSRILRFGINITDATNHSGQAINTNLPVHPVQIPLWKIKDNRPYQPADKPTIENPFNIGFHPLSTVQGLIFNDEKAIVEIPPHLRSHSTIPSKPSIAIFASKQALYHALPQLYNQINQQTFQEYTIHWYELSADMTSYDITLAAMQTFDSFSLLYSHLYPIASQQSASNPAINQYNTINAFNAISEKLLHEFSYGTNIALLFMESTSIHNQIASSNLDEALDTIRASRGENRFFQFEVHHLRTRGMSLENIQFLEAILDTSNRGRGELYRDELSTKPQVTFDRWLTHLHRHNATGLAREIEAINLRDLDNDNKVQMGYFITRYGLSYLTTNLSHYMQYTGTYQNTQVLKYISQWQNDNSPQDPFAIGSITAESWFRDTYAELEANGNRNYLDHLKAAIDTALYDNSCGNFFIPLELFENWK